MEIRDNLYRCTKCLFFKGRDEFHKSSKKLGIRKSCKPCRVLERRLRYLASVEKEAEYGRQYKINNLEKRLDTSRRSSSKKRKFFRDFRDTIKNVNCFDCGKKYPPCAMDFDHREPIFKSFNISEAQSKNLEVIKEEIKKCDVVCANCHRIREASRRNTKKLTYYSPIVNPLKNKPCMDCHIKYESFVMDFDHTDPFKKSFHISKPKFKTEDKKKELIEEIMKCDVVCANCHRIRTFVKIKDDE